jgi:hypothetical protein
MDFTSFVKLRITSTMTIFGIYALLKGKDAETSLR